MPLIVNFTLAASETCRNNNYDPLTQKKLEVPVVKKKLMKILNYAYNDLYGERRSKRCIKYFVCSLLQLCVRIQCEDMVSRLANLQQSENVPSGYYVHNIDNSLM